MKGQIVSFVGDILHKRCAMTNIALAIFTLALLVVPATATGALGNQVESQLDTAIEEKVATDTEKTQKENAVITQGATAGIRFEESAKSENTTANAANAKSKTATSITSAKKTAIVKSAVVKKTTHANANSISVLGRTIAIKKVSDTTVESGRSVALFGNGFLYGHNTSSVFGVLSRANTGTNFSVTLNGQSKNYKVAKTVVLTKEETKRYMYALTKTQSFDGKKYDLVLMTCAGKSVGNGDATHRRIVLANQL